MDPDFLRYYNRELQFIREMGAEFARDYPKIAGRLGLEGFECADPYVERLLEGFAFLTARVQLKLDAEFPSFTQHLLEMVYPHYLAPTPSMAVVQFQPDPAKGDLSKGFPIPRGTSLRSLLGRGERTACEYRTSADVTLWPIELIEARPLTTAAALAIEAQGVKGVKSGIRFRLRTTTGVPFAALPLERLRLFLRGGDGSRMRLHEELLGHALALVARPGTPEPEWRVQLAPSHIQSVGFEESEALLPHGPRSFQGYRLLREYFAFPERFLFVDLTGLGQAARRCAASELEIIVLLDRGRLEEDAFDASYFALHCVPAINLFPKRLDRIHLTNRGHEHHVVADRTRPLDYEIFSLQEVAGIGAHTEPEQVFRPFHSARDTADERSARAYYSVHREPRRPSTQQQTRGPRSSYLGSEIFVSLVDADQAPYRRDLRQLAISALCTNRDLPLQLPLGKGATDFTLETGAPVGAIRCVAGPTRPLPSFPKGDSAWRLVSHLALNYLSLSDQDAEQGATALRELLALYAAPNDAATRRQVEGVRSIRAMPVIRRLPGPGRVTHGRGLQVRLTLDPAAFEGSGIFLFGAVLEQFLAKYVSINSFTETIVDTPDAVEIMRWPARIGRRHTC